MLRAPPRAHGGYSWPPPPCALLRVSCSLHRPCRVPFLAPSQDGKTAFHLAAANGRVAAMEFLLAHGADLNAVDEVRAPLEVLWLEVRMEGVKGAALHEGLS